MAADAQYAPASCAAVCDAAVLLTSFARSLFASASESFSALHISLRV